VDPEWSPVVWACVEDGFYVGNVGGEFVGYVDTHPDGHHAFDELAHPLGVFDSLAAAMARLSNHRGSRTDASSGVRG
jgi:hypothetical protein